jgi:cysteine synthase
MKPNNKRVYNNILEVVGNTPMVKLNKLSKDYGIKC